MPPSSLIESLVRVPAPKGRDIFIVTLPWAPGLNHYYRTPKGMSHPILSAEGRAYKNSAGVWVWAAGITTPVLGPLFVDLTCYRPRKRGDIDGPLKAVLDAMNGHLWVDDDQIVELFVHRRDDKAKPRVEVVVWEVEP